jgi:Icc protein
MRLVQITDLHIDSRDPDNGLPALEKFRRTIANIKQLTPDALILTGDFCMNEPRIDIYETIAEELATCSFPRYLIGGNHDSVEQLSEIFGLEAKLRNGELYYSVPFGEREVLFLDTHRNAVSTQQLGWIQDQLARQSRAVMIFSHHPPLLAGVPFMDRNYPLTNHAAVLELLRNHGYPVTVFCGHYHVERCISYQNVIIHITPSASYQIDPLEKDFARDHDHPGFRVIDLSEDRIETAVRYLWD